MRDGGTHPAARTAVLSYTFTLGEGGLPDILDMSIADSRLAVFGAVSGTHATQIVVWDWTTGQILQVRRPLTFNSGLMWTAHQGVRGRVLPVCGAC